MASNIVSQFRPARRKSGDQTREISSYQGDFNCICQQCRQDNICEEPIEKLMEYYSSFYRLKKAICWLLRVRKCLKGDKPNQGCLTVTEMNYAEKLIIKFAQYQVYPEEISTLKQGKNVLKSSPIKKLTPALKDGILVVAGRLKHASISTETKYPMLLPHDHRISYLIVHECHNSAHLGTEWTLRLIRDKYWITHARGLVKRIKRNCLVCKKLYGVPLNQKMADLPPERCEAGKPPFSYVGVDLFGPFYVKLGRSEVKRHGFELWLIQGGGV